MKAYEAANIRDSLELQIYLALEVMEGFPSQKVLHSLPAPLER